MKITKICYDTDSVTLGHAPMQTHKRTNMPARQTTPQDIAVVSKCLCAYAFMSVCHKCTAIRNLADAHVKYVVYDIQYKQQRMAAICQCAYCYKFFFFNFFYFTYFPLLLILIIILLLMHIFLCWYMCCGFCFSHYRAYFLPLLVCCQFNFVHCMFHATNRQKCRISRI